MQLSIPNLHPHRKCFLPAYRTLDYLASSTEGLVHDAVTV
jgi:hypothetical protein